MWFNQAKCDIYMGTGAGTKLLQEIGNAQRSVKISSPYLSLKMVEELIWLHNQGIEVSLITSDTYDSRSQRQEKSIQPLVIQNQHFDQNAYRIRKRWLTIQKGFTAISIVLTALLITLFLSTNNWFYIFTIGIACLIFWISRYAKRKAKTTRIYSYTYSPLFPFKVFVAPDAYRINDMFIHGKIYIIDGQTAYLGSLNFTESGTKYNYETRVRVTDIHAVRQIEAEFDELYNHPDLAFVGIEKWGKAMHYEEIN